MAEHVHDGYGDHLRIARGDSGKVQLTLTQKGAEDQHDIEATLAPVDPEAVIAAIRVAAGLTEERVTDEHFPNGSRKVTTVHSDGTTSEHWITPQELSFEEATAIRGRGGERPHTFQDNEQRLVLTRTDDFNFIITVTDASGEATINRVAGRDLVAVIQDRMGLDDGPEEDPEKLRGKYVHTTPATAEEPRVWAGADEPIIDQLIGRVADLEEGHVQGEVFAHQHLSEHWESRLDVARLALAMAPAKGQVKPTGAMSALFGSERSGEVSVTDALKIARFAADEDRDIPGVDR